MQRFYNRNRYQFRKKDMYRNRNKVKRNRGWEDTNERRRDVRRAWQKEGVWFSSVDKGGWLIVYYHCSERYLVINVTSFCLFSWVTTLPHVAAPLFHLSSASQSFIFSNEPFCLPVYNSFPLSFRTSSVWCPQAHITPTPIPLFLCV